MILNYKKPEGSWIAFMGDLVKQHGGLNLAQGIPGFQPPVELIEILNDISSQNVHQYPPGTGNFKLINQLLQYYQRYYDFDTNNFMVVQGATEGISLIYTYLSTFIVGNFTVLAFDPPYESFANLPKIFKHNFIKYPIPLQNGVNLDELENIIIKNRVKIIFLCSPGNPFGKAFTKNELIGIIHIAKKNDCYVIFDHVYKDIYFENETYNPLINFYPNLFYVNSFSKSLSITGWRVGFLIAHNIHIPKIKSIHDYIGLCAPSILQQAVANYIKKYNFGIAYTNFIRKKLNNSYLLLKNALEELNFRIPKIDGGYFIWAQIPDEYKGSAEFCISLFNKERVAITPGIHFSENSNRFIRINIGLEEEKIIEGIERIKRFMVIGIN